MGFPAFLTLKQKNARNPLQESARFIKTDRMKRMLYLSLQLLQIPYNSMRSP